MPIEKAPRTFQPGDIVVSTFKEYFIDKAHAGIFWKKKRIVERREEESVIVIDVTYSNEDQDRAKVSQNERWIFKLNEFSPFTLNFKGFPHLSDKTLLNTIRKRVISFAERFVGRHQCIYDKERKTYKPDIPISKALDKNTLDEELYFTCSGFVEYIFEQSGCDIIVDDDPSQDLPEERLFPWYLIAACHEKVNNEGDYPFKITRKLHEVLADNSSKLARFYALPDESLED